jgi:gamma-glutamylcysteine synthetase
MCEHLQAHEVEFRDWVQALAVQHRQTLTAMPLAAATRARLEQLAAESWQGQADLEAQSTGSFAAYVAQFLAQTEQLELADASIKTTEVLV